MSETEQIAETPQVAGSSKFYYTVAGYNILLESGIKTEIIESQDVFPIPHTPAWCQGMISLRGKLIPVVNLQKVLQGHQQDKPRWLLIVEKDPYPQLAIGIDQLPMQQMLSEEPFETLDPEKFANWLESSVSVDDKTLYAANHSTLFEQLIQVNETSQSDLQQPQPVLTSNPDSPGNNA